MKVKDLLNKNKQKVQDTTPAKPPSEPAKKEAVKNSFPEVPVSPHRKVIARICEVARRLGFVVYEVEYKGKIYIYEVLGDKERLLMKVDPTDYESLTDLEWHVANEVGRILLKTEGGKS